MGENRVLEKMNKEINILKKRIEMIEKLDIKPIDEKTWHEICLTPVRHEHELLKSIAKATFPQGDNFKVHANEVTFNLNGFDIKLPTCAFKGIEIDLKWFKPLYGEPPKEYKRFDNMRKYFELLDSNNYTWYELACCRCNSDDIKGNKFKLFTWWFCKAKWRNANREKWENYFKDEDNQNKRRLEEHEKK